MKLTCTILCLLLLSSCVHYGVQRDFGEEKSSACSNGSSKENQTCKEELKAINKAIENNIQQ